MNTAIRSSNKIARGWGSFKDSKKERETKQKQAETSLQSKIARDPEPGQGDLISVSLLLCWLETLFRTLSVPNTVSEPLWKYPKRLYLETASLYFLLRVL